MKKETTTRPEWTIMVYVAADDGLANFAVESLKQLRNTAGGTIAVAAELGVEDSEYPLSRRYLFSQKNPNGRLRSDPHPNGSEVDWEAPENTKMTDPDRLKDFIKWSLKWAEADNYCLILWGHGPVLDYQPPKTKGRRALYLSPLDLGNALRAAGPEKEKFKIIALDACSMSMVEYAAELANLADYMIASQEEVPDPSFPYDTLVKSFRQHGHNVETLCETSVVDYVEAYQDCICNGATGMKPCTLSALRLAGIDALKKALTALVVELRSLVGQQNVAEAIHQARKESQGFVGGLCVDLSDFCDKLSSQLEAIHSDEAKRASELCGNVRAAIDSKTGCVIANEVAEQPWRKGESDADKVVNPRSCHGLSVYFPYLKDHEEEQIKMFNLVKGASGPGGDLGGKTSQIVNEAATDLRFAVRRGIIEDMESFNQPDKKGETFQFEQTGWYDFIKCDWSRILAEREPHQLDVRYWGQQCARNLANAKPKAVPAQNAPVALVP